MTRLPRAALGCWLLVFLGPIEHSCRHADFDARIKQLETLK